MHKVQKSISPNMIALTGSSLVSVLLGLATGTALVVMFSILLLTPSFSFTPGSLANADIRVAAMTDKLDEAKVFYSQYPSRETRVDRTGNEIEGPAVKYSFQKDYEDGMINEVRMFVMLDEKTSVPTGEIYISCAVWSEGGSGMTYISNESNMTKVLLMTGCAR